MIKYKLNCKSCNFLFNSWFGSSNEYEKLKNKNLLNCINCNSTKVEKSLMAPKFLNRCTIKKTNQEKDKLRNFTKTIKKYQNFIKKNFKYVGRNFAYEARSLHYDKGKTNKKIYGNASNDELRELKEEGIQTQIIPWIEDKNN